MVWIKVVGKSGLRCGRDEDGPAVASSEATDAFAFAAFGGAFGRSCASILFAAAVRSESDPVRGIPGIFAAGFAFAFGFVVFAAGFFAAAFFATVFFVDAVFPALELRRDFPEELAFFMRRILPIGMQNVKPIVQEPRIASEAANRESASVQTPRLPGKLPFLISQQHGHRGAFCG